MSIILSAEFKSAFTKLITQALTYRVTVKDASQLEFQPRVRKGDVASILLRTRDGAELPGTACNIGADMWGQLGFSSGEEVVSFLERAGVKRMKRQRRTPYRSSPYD